MSASTHLYGRRLVLEWAASEDTVDDVRRRTTSHFSEGKLWDLIYIQSSCELVKKNLINSAIIANSKTGPPTKRNKKLELTANDSD